MENSSALRSGIRVVLRHPLIWMIPLAWDVIKWGLAWGLEQIQLGWVRWDFNVSWTVGSENAPYRILLPPALPSAEQLGVAFGGQAVMDWSWMARAAVPVILMTLVEPMARGGYLNLLNGSLRGIRPSWWVWARGIRRFGPGQLVLTLLWIGVALVLQPLVLATPQVGSLALTVLLACFYLAQYLVITDDALAITAVLGAPALFVSHLNCLVGPILLSAVTTFAVTAFLPILGPVQPLVAVPLWAFLGSILAAIMMAGLLDGISTRREPSMPWACPSCGAQNAQAADQCVVCGHRLAG